MTEAIFIDAVLVLLARCRNVTGGFVSERVDALLGNTSATALLRMVDVSNVACIFLDARLLARECARRLAGHLDGKTADEMRSILELPKRETLTNDMAEEKNLPTEQLFLLSDRGEKDFWANQMMKIMKGSSDLTVVVVSVKLPGEMKNPSEAGHTVYLIARLMPGSQASFRLASLASHLCKYSPLLSAGVSLSQQWTRPATFPYYWAPKHRFHSNSLCPVIFPTPLPAQPSSIPFFVRSAHLLLSKDIVPTSSLLYGHTITGELESTDGFVQIGHHHCAGEEESLVSSKFVTYLVEF
ncbi:hypothetical protein Y032_0099g3147 [Ancylostoma ceylanicum]|uniref:Uncharacterized protein n=2 Tax=Ancylostoma ceylanicum TaxID=53326 RepID=A0A016TII9_9BILA|nr:hypothetical protein Y032_0099g3147 [Ancylostoma ceylanicum]